MDELPQFPLTRYHPVLGAVVANTYEEALQKFQPERDFFKTPEEADMHRTQREASAVEHASQRVVVDTFGGNDAVVQHSVSHQVVIEREGPSGQEVKDVPAGEAVKESIATDRQDNPPETDKTFPVPPRTEDDPKEG